MNTTFKTATDFRKSLETRLQVLAAKTKEDLQRIRRKVAFDRFLARIFSNRCFLAKLREIDGAKMVQQTSYCTNFIQKQPVAF